MTDARTRLQTALDRTVALALGGLIVGPALAFGGAVWWGPVLVAVLGGALALAWVARAAAYGSFGLLKSPLAGLGLLAIGLAAFQSVPIPGMVAARISPNGHAVRALGLLPDLARSDDPGFVPPEPAPGPSPLTIDRAATLRWIGAALVGLLVFVVASHFADRLDRLYRIWGSVVAVFLLNASIAAIQVVGHAEGLYGFIEPGKGPGWGPTVLDALDSPGETVLRPIGLSRPLAHPWALPRPDPRPQVGTMMGGPGSILALGSLGLPLALAITLQLMAPRGSREGLWSRLADSGRGSLLVLLYAMTVASAMVVGLLGGPGLALPFAAAILLVGLPCVFGTGLGFKALALTTLCLGSLGAGVAIGEGWDAAFPTAPRLPRVDLGASRRVWSDAAAIARDFPTIGVGLGGFASIQPYYKTRDAASNTAMSSLLQWRAEAGYAGLGLLALAGIWGLVRLPGAVRRVGAADRALATGAVGAAACFGMVSAVHWTVELMAVGLAGCAVAGTCDRWLAGGTDLFVERG